MPPEAAASALRVLVADDEPLSRVVVASLLRRAGHSVSEVADGTAALEALDARLFDLLLIDLRMPGLDGLATLERVRAHPDPARAGCAVVILTASALDAELAAVRAAGADLVLAKPFRLEMLDAWMQQRRSEGARSPQAAAEPPAGGLDVAPLNELRSMLPAERVAYLIGTAITALETQGESLRAAGLAGDSAAAGTAAHRIAGVAGMYGCPALSESARALERALAGGGPAEPLHATVLALLGPALAFLRRQHAARGL